LTRDLSYRASAAQKDKQIITDIAVESEEIENTQKSLAARKVQLESLQAKLDKEAEFFRGEVKKAKDYQRELSAKIADLSARQQAILAEKAGTFQTTVGDVPLADDPASRPDYNPGFSPAFAAFSFGAPHFKGLSQYGAFGRAKSGQSAEDILRAYYGSGIEIKKDYSTGININVQGYGSVDLETYAKRIYEMPGSWGDEGGMEALKAQAVAARVEDRPGLLSEAEDDAPLVLPEDLDHRTEEEQHRDGCKDDSEEQVEFRHSVLLKPRRLCHFEGQPVDPGHRHRLSLGHRAALRHRAPVLSLDEHLAGRVERRARHRHLAD